MFKDDLGKISLKDIVLECYLIQYIDKVSGGIDMVIQSDFRSDVMIYSDIYNNFKFKGFRETFL